MTSVDANTTDMSTDGSDEPLICTQDLNEISSQNNGLNGEKSDENETQIEWFDSIGDQNLPKVRHDSKILSQEVVSQRMDVWKGVPVINYKKFQKYSQNSSQTSKSQPLVRLKIVKNDYYKSFSQRQTDEDIEDTIDFDGDKGKSIKRKLDFETNIGRNNTEEEASDPKKIKSETIEPKEEVLNIDSNAVKV